MKTLLAFLLAGLMLLSLCACRNVQDEDVNLTEAVSEATEAALSKDELLNTAESATIKQMANDIDSNIARASSTYCGKAFLIWGRVAEIHTEYVELGCYIYGNDRFVRAYLPTDSIMSLNTGDVIQIVGIVDELIEEQSEKGSSHLFLMNQAFFVTDEYEVNEAKITHAVFELNDDINFTVEDPVFGEVHLVYRLPEDDRWLAYSSNYPNYALTASGKLRWNGEEYEYRLQCDTATYTEWKK